MTDANLALNETTGETQYALCDGPFANRACQLVNRLDQFLINFPKNQVNGFSANCQQENEFSLFLSGIFVGPLTSLQNLKEVLKYRARFFEG
jgi:hypothetical protein